MSTQIPRKRKAEADSKIAVQVRWNDEDVQKPLFEIFAENRGPQPVRITAVELFHRARGAWHPCRDWSAGRPCAAMRTSTESACLHNARSDQTTLDFLHVGACVAFGKRYMALKSQRYDVVGHVVRGGGSGRAAIFRAGLEDAEVGFAFNCFTQDEFPSVYGMATAMHIQHSKIRVHYVNLVTCETGKASHTFAPPEIDSSDSGDTSSPGSDSSDSDDASSESDSSDSETSD